MTLEVFLAKYESEYEKDEGESEKVHLLSKTVLNKCLQFEEKGINLKELGSGLRVAKEHFLFRCNPILEEIKAIGGTPIKQFQGLLDMSKKSERFCKGLGNELIEKHILGETAFKIAQLPLLAKVPSLSLSLSLSPAGSLNDIIIDMR